MVARFLANFVPPGAPYFLGQNLQEIFQPRNFSFFLIKINFWNSLSSLYDIMVEAAVLDLSFNSL